MFYTTDEAAQYLAERGYIVKRGRTAKRGAPSADTVKHMCAAGKFPGARREQRGPGRGYWLIPEADLAALLVPVSRA